MNKPQKAPEVKMRFKRSKFCRVIHVDGAWGSLTLQGNIHMALFSEHRAFPEGTTISLNEQGVVQETMMDDPGVTIREIEADVILNPGGAVVLRDWLTGRLTELETALKQMQAQAQPQT
jgi:hypothetical protein